TLTPKDNVWSYSGVRPLMQGEREEGKAASKVTRDYHFEIEDDEGKAPLLSIFGGKLTTYRKLAQAAVNGLQPYFPGMKAAWTKDAVLPGGEGIRTPQDYALELQRDYRFLPPKTARRLATTYGRLALQWLANAQSEAELGERFGPLYEAEVRYLVANEWAETLQDIIWRRTKTGIAMADADVKRLEEFLNREYGATNAVGARAVNA
ncbi:MAG: glycerol-3-phosphate dehydrogenase C-terminal domain-containing protein, partial [Natronospirillum sp.]